MTYSWNIYYSFVLPVNKSLLTIFLASKFAEQSGHGIPTIVENYGRNVFSFEDGMLKVTNADCHDGLFPSGSHQLLYADRKY